MCIRDSLEALQAEYEQLQTSHAEYTGQLAAVQEELKPLKDVYKRQVY